MDNWPSAIDTVRLIDELVLSLRSGSVNSLIGRSKDEHGSFTTLEPMTATSFSPERRGLLAGWFIFTIAIVLLML